MTGGLAQGQPMKKIRSLLVANRSEIAIRELRAASEMGIRTVAIFSNEDRFALHRFKADESYLVGKAPKLPATQHVVNWSGCPECASCLPKTTPKAFGSMGQRPIRAVEPSGIGTCSPPTTRFSFRTVIQAAVIQQMQDNFPVDARTGGIGDRQPSANALPHRLALGIE